MTSAPHRDTDDALAELLAPLLRQYREQSGAPVVVAALTDRERLLAVCSDGQGPLDGDLARARFQIGSISKPMTAALALHAQECGWLSLQQPAADYLPLLRAPSLERITLHQLLTHTAGLSIGSAAAPWSEWEGYVASRLPRLLPAGGRPYYSNLGYNLLGEAVSVACARPLQELLREHLFVPLGMDDTSGAILPGAQVHAVSGFMPDPLFVQHWLGDPLVPAPWEPHFGGSGCVVSSAADVAAFLRKLLARAPGSPWADMLRTRVEMDGGLSYGYGLFLDLKDSRRRCFHPGGMLGYRSLMMGDLDSGLGVAIMSNLGGPQRGSLIVRLGHAALDRAAEALRGTGNGIVGSVAYPATDLDRYCGTYLDAGGNVNKRLDLVLASGRLALKEAGHCHPVQWVERDRFITRCPGWSDFEFILVFDGQELAAVQYGPSRLVPESVFRPPPSPAKQPEGPVLAGVYRSRNPWAPAVQVSMSEEGWMAHVGHLAARMRPVGLRVFQLEGTPEILAFTAEYEGRMLQLELSGSVYYRCRDDC